MPCALKGSVTSTVGTRRANSSNMPSAGTKPSDVSKRLVVQPYRRLSNILRESCRRVYLPDARKKGDKYFNRCPAREGDTRPAKRRRSPRFKLHLTTSFERCTDRLFSAWMPVVREGAKCQRTHTLVFTQPSDATGRLYCGVAKWCVGEVVEATYRPTFAQLISVREGEEKAADRNSDHICCPVTAIRPRCIVTTH